MAADQKIELFRAYFKFPSRLSPSRKRRAYSQHGSIYEKRTVSQTLSLGNILFYLDTTYRASES